MLAIQASLLGDDDRAIWNLKLVCDLLVGSLRPHFFIAMGQGDFEKISYYFERRVFRKHL